MISRLLVTNVLFLVETERIRQQDFGNTVPHGIHTMRKFVIRFIRWFAVFVLAPTIVVNFFFELCASWMNHNLIVLYKLNTVVHTVLTLPGRFCLNTFFLQLRNGFRFSTITNNLLPP